jgi:fatty acid desaturase
MMKWIAPWAFVMLFFGGMMVAGADGDYFPWTLVAGVVMAAAALIFVPELKRQANEIND